MTDGIQQLLDGLGLAKYAQVFAENEIDLDVLPHLAEDDLEELGLPMGPRKKLLAAIAGLGAPAPVAAEPGDLAREAERRQLTVMFVDLVGSTEIAGRLDPEDLREVMRRYQDAVAGVVTRYAGHVAKYLGDGVLIYFGWPQAHEDQTERAVRAGLDALAAVSTLELDGDDTLSARAGIATGQVVIGDLVGEAGAVSGETPNLAARLQETARPGQVTIAEATRLLIAGAFELESLGARTLKGFAEPVPAWRVVGAREVESRFEAAHGAALTPFVGREHEIGLLLDRWAQAKLGEGQVVQLSGEAGIGKSRITQTLRERVAEEPQIRLRFQCAPYYTSTALHPFIRQFEHAAGFAPDDDADAKLDKIEALIAGPPEAVAEAAPIFAALLSVPAGNRYPAPDLAPQLVREKTLAALCDQLVALAARRPVLLIFEDAHWADPTTLEALELIIGRIQGLPALAVITARPEFAAPWHGHSHLTALMLNRLGSGHCASIVANVTDGKALPEEVFDQIVAKTDGVPLFVEELTKTVLESGILEERGGRYVLTGPLPPLAIPSTLQDSLMARLDRLSSVKEVAQIGAAIGRDFSYPVLAATATLSEPELHSALSELVDAGLIFQRGAPPDANYTFKHALLQDAAYASLLKARRQLLHRQIAEALESSPSGLADQEPELVAHHLTVAGLTTRAVPYWRRAGERALARYTNQEAVVHFTKALEHLADMPEGRERDVLELELSLSLGPAQLATVGFASPEAGETYDRAYALCELVGETHQKFAATWGLWLNNQQGARFEVAERFARELVVVAEQQTETDFRLQASHSAWTSLLARGDPVRCREHVEQGLALYDRAEHGGHAHVYGGHDPGVCSRAHAGMSSWLLGYPDRAVPFVRDGIALAEELEQPVSQLVVLTFGGFVHQFRGDAEQAREMADMAVSLGKAHNVPQHLAMARIIHGWALMADGSTVDGLEEMDQGLSQYRATGAKIRRSYYLSLLAEGCIVAEEFERGLRTLEEAEAISGQIGERWWLAEVHRLRGETLMASGGDPVAAEDCFQQALRVSGEQQARSLELRASTSLARLWAAGDRRAEAKSLLAPVHGGFSEGFDTADLTRAKDLLDDLP